MVDCWLLRQRNHGSYFTLFQVYNHSHVFSTNVCCFADANKRNRGGDSSINFIMNTKSKFEEKEKIVDLNDIYESFALNIVMTTLWSQLYKVELD